MVKSAAPCEGTSYEIGGIALVKGARNREAAKRYYDWLMSPAGQSLGAKANSLQYPANKTFKVDPKIPTLDNVRLDQVRLREVRQGGGAQAPDRALGEGSELAAALRARRLERSPTDALGAWPRPSGGRLHSCPRSQPCGCDLSILRCVARPTSVATLSCSKSISTVDGSGRWGALRSEVLEGELRRSRGSGDMSGQSAPPARSDP